MVEADNIYYINKTHPSCSNSYTPAQANSQNTPWCNLSSITTTSSTTYSRLLGGDTVYIAEGEYNDVDSRYIILNNSINLPITITAYPNNDVNISHYTTLTWTNISSNYAGMNIWNATFSDLGSNTLSINYPNGTRLIEHRCLNNTGTSKSQPCPTSSAINYGNWLLYQSRDFEGSWGNATTKEVIIRIASGKNPNNLNLRVSNSFSLSIRANRDKTVTLSNLTFKDTWEPLEIYNASNIVLEYNTYDGGHRAVRLRGKKLATGTFTSRFNTYYGRWNPSWYQAFAKQSYLEYAMIEADAPQTTEGTNLTTYIYNETCFDCGGGIILNYDTAQGCGSEWHDNTFYNAYQAIIETDGAGCNMSIYNNKVYGGWFAYSLAPWDCLANAPCKFYNNYAVTDFDYQYNETVRYNTYTMKLESRENSDGVQYIDYINITHNTFISPRPWNNIVDTISRGLKNVTVINNIFYAYDDYILLQTGEARDNNTWDYNLYYTNASASFARYYSNVTKAVTYATLASAIASGNDLGRWNTNSVQTNPLFIPNTYQPHADSSACDMGSDGGYVGALECDTENYLDFSPVPVNQNIIYPNNLTYDFNATIVNVNFTTNNTINFTINRTTGVLRNNATLGIGIYWHNITITSETYSVSRLWYVNVSEEVVPTPENGNDYSSISTGMAFFASGLTILILVIMTSFVVGIINAKKSGQKLDFNKLTITAMWILVVMIIITLGLAIIGLMINQL
jgi:hypothetical protein